MATVISGNLPRNWADIAALSPYVTSHIKRFGDYLMDLKTIPNTLNEVTDFVFA